MARRVVAAALLLGAATADAGEIGVQRIAVPGTALPLVVILHGNQGVPENHRQTALALAEAGFVAAAVRHEADVAILERAASRRS